MSGREEARSGGRAHTSGRLRRWLAAPLTAVGLGLLCGPAAAHGFTEMPPLGGAQAVEQRSALGPEHAADHADRPKRQLVPAPETGLTTANAFTGGTPAEVGRWGTDYFPLPNYAIHAVMLPTGKVLFWGYPPEPEEGGARPNGGEAALWDPKLGAGPAAITEVDPPLVDPDGPAGPQGPVRAPLYCSGQTLLPNGAVLAAGGNLVWPGADPNDPYTAYAGADFVYSFDPWSERWRAQPSMQGGRWYPSQVPLPDGRTGILGGFGEKAPGASLNNTVETFTPAAAPGGVGAVRKVGAGTAFLTALYPHLTTLPDGKVLMSGPGAGDYGILDFPARGKVSRAYLPTAPDGFNRVGSNAVLLPAGPRGGWSVRQIGGFDDTRPVDPQAAPEQMRYQALATTVTTDGRKRVSRMTERLPSPRSYGNTVLLPDGSMVEVGGGNGRSAAEGSYEAIEADKRVQVYDPASGRWRLGPNQREYRTYHSTALLLPDGRVFSAGDDYHPTEPVPDSPGYYRSSRGDTAEIYRPGYLFDGPRPTIRRAPKRLGYGDDFEVRTGGGRVTEAVLMSPGATTHGADMGQRRVALRVRDRLRGGRGLSLRAPANSRIAQPGYYMLFVLTEGGTPSIARWVRLGS